MQGMYDCPKNEINNNATITIVGDIGIRING